MSSDKELKYKLSLQDLFTKSMRNAVSETQKMDSTMSGLGSQIKRVAAFVGVSALGREIIQTGASFERAEIQLKTLLKSTTEAKRVFNDLKEESTRSPFGFDTLLQGNAALISTGLSAKDAKEDFNALANAIAATGGTEDTLSRMVFNLQQIKNVGAATAVDIKQFGMAGINIYSILADYYKKNHISLGQQKGDYAQITGALKLASQEGGRYFGALDNLSDSSSGKLSNLSDSWKNFQYELFERAKPAIDSTVSALTGLMNWTIRNLGAIKGLAIGVGTVAAVYTAWNGLIKLNIWYHGLSKTAIILNTLATEGLSAATVAFNLALESSNLLIGISAGLFGALAVAIYGAISSYNEYQDILSGKGRLDTQTGIKTEIESVNRLADSYSKMGMSKEKAMRTAIAQERSSLNDKISDLQSNPLSADPLSSQGRLLADAKGQLSALNDEQGLISGYKNKLAPASAGKASGGSSSTSVGSSTEVSSARPQSLVININDGLVKSQVINIQGAGPDIIKQFKDKVRQWSTEALLESANDANMMAR